MTKAEFHEVHGPIWEKIVREPSFFAAMQVCGSERLKEIENLSAAEIESNGKVHLASFQGHLKTESILLGLAIESQDGGVDLPPADYGAPAPEDSPFFPIVEPPPKPKNRKRK